MYLWKTLMNFLATPIFCMHNLWMIYQRYPLLIQQNYLEGANLWHINFLQMMYNDCRKMTLGRGSAENTGYWPWVRCSLEYFTLQSHLDQSSRGLESHYRHLFSHHFFSLNTNSESFHGGKGSTTSNYFPADVSSWLILGSFPNCGCAWYPNIFWIWDSWTGTALDRGGKNQEWALCNPK